MRMYDYNCEKCDLDFEDLEIEGTKIVCPQCGDFSLVTRKPSSFGGYTMKGDNSASTRPRMAGYRTKRSRL